MKKLEPEVLERLLMDRTFGEMNSDISSLMDACLDVYPDFQELEKSVSETIRLTREALPSSSRELLDSAAISQAAKKAVWRYRRSVAWKSLIGAAALILVSFSMGYYMNIRNTSAPDESHGTPSVLTASTDYQEESSFWSRENLAPDGNHPRRVPQSTPPAQSITSIIFTRHEK